VGHRLIFPLEQGLLVGTALQGNHLDGSAEDQNIVFSGSLSLYDLPDRPGVVGNG